MNTSAYIENRRLDYERARVIIGVMETRIRGWGAIRRPGSTAAAHRRYADTFAKQRARMGGPVDDKGAQLGQHAPCTGIAAAQVTNSGVKERKEARVKKEIKNQRERGSVIVVV